MEDREKGIKKKKMREMRDKVNKTKKSSERD